MAAAVALIAPPPTKEITMPGNAPPNRKDGKRSLKQRDRDALKAAKTQLRGTMQAALEYQKAVQNMINSAQARIDGLGNVLHDVKDVLDEVRPSFLNESENAILIDAALVSIGEVIQPKKLPEVPAEIQTVVAGNEMPASVDHIVEADGFVKETSAIL
jgi:hypothetical protein